MLMFQLVAVQMYDHHAAALAVSERCLGDELLRQFIIKITCFPMLCFFHHSCLPETTMVSYNKMHCRMIFGRHKGIVGLIGYRKM